MKNTIKKILLYGFGILVLAILLIVGYVKFVLPTVESPTYLKISVTPERIVHGEYLANHVAVCMDCHSTRDWSRFSGPLVPNTLGKGGEYFGQEVGFPGKFYSKNLTPTHLGSWTDAEIFGAITTGVNKEGEALFPVMPYLSYGKMDKEDIYDIIAYLRSLPPVENEIPKRDIDFPMNFIINTMPQNTAFVKRPDPSEKVEYGAYLVNAASCIECHTQVEKGQIIPELAFSGGREFKMPNGIVRSANITPDVETGIGFWTEETFLNRFKAYSKPESIYEIKEGQVNTIMPWAMYAGMKTSDLKAIYAYLNTLKPIKNKVVHFSPNK
ncbi:MAG TPA: c-type cytochrome [Salinimicrobium sp.]|nr:c-type cytochrome [Salinimicrobium sp.]